MRLALLITMLALCLGCSKATIKSDASISEDDLQKFFRKHKINNHSAVALKKHSIGDSYLATIHGYPNNLSVCEELIAPYNKDSALSTIPGDYYCEVLQ